MRPSKKIIFWITGISLASVMVALCLLLYSSNCDYIALIRYLYGAERRCVETQNLIRGNLNSADIAKLEKLLPGKPLFLNSSKAGWTNLPTSILNEHPTFAILEPKYIDFNWNVCIGVVQVLHIDWRYPADEVKQKIKEDVKQRQLNAVVFSFSKIRMTNPSITFYKAIIL